MKLSNLQRGILGVIFSMLLVTLFVSPAFAQAVPAAGGNSAAKFLGLVGAIAVLVQAAKGFLNTSFPNLIKGKGAVILTVVLSITGTLASIDVSTATWQTIGLTLFGLLFGASGLFAVIKSLFTKQPPAPAKV